MTVMSKVLLGHCCRSASHTHGAHTRKRFEDLLSAERRAIMTRAMRTGTLLVALVVLATYWAGDGSESER